MCINVCSWISFLYTAVGCPTGMVYQQCGPLCPQTCDNIGVPCQGGCAEGCFCPDGQVLLDGQCVDPFRCTGQLEIQPNMCNVPIHCIIAI